MTNIFEGSEMKCSNLEIIKGIEGHQNTDTLVIPIIENTHHEQELAAEVEAVVKIYPNSPAVLVRNHGIYVWGRDWKQAKIHAECIDYICGVLSDMLLPHSEPLAVIDSKGVVLPRTAPCLKESKELQPRVWRVPELMDDPNEIGYTEDGVNITGTEPKEFLDFDVLKKVGVRFDILSGEEDDPNLLDLMVRDSYKNKDVVCLDGSKMEPEKYKGMTRKFFETHYHSDDEVRYILEGGGYFDCMLDDGKWWRIQVKKGDVLAIPEFLWHRFVCDTAHFVKAMRLFKEAPKWEALTDPQQPERTEKNIEELMLAEDEKKV